MNKLNSVQFCRAIAFIMVLFLHAIPSWDYYYILKHGNYGVLLFFIISGFIMTFVSMNKANQTPMSFLLKRFFRIYPVYWFVTVACIIISYYNYKNGVSGWSPLASFGDIGWFSTLTLLPVSNGYLVNMVSWSLTYEVWYYILFSMLLLLLKEKYFIGIAIYAYIVFLYQMILGLGIIEISNGSVDFSIIFSTLNWFFVIGSCIAYYFFENEKKYMGLCKFTFFFCVVVQVLVGGDNAYAAKGGILLEALLLLMSLTIFISAILLEKKEQVRFPRFFVFIGNISYSLYLIHYAGLYLFNKFFELFGFSIGYTYKMLAYYILLLLAGSAIYYLLELPSNRYLRMKFIR